MPEYTDNDDDQPQEAEATSPSEHSVNSGMCNKS